MSCEGCPEATAAPPGMRLPDWGVQLFEWSESVVGRPFIWGETDCGMLVRGAVEAMYGDWPGPEVPAYSDERSATRAQLMVRGVPGALRSMGAEDRTLAYAQSGDVAVRPPRNGHKTIRAGVVVSGKLVVTSPESGVVRRRIQSLDDDTTLLRLPVVLD